MSNPSPIFSPDPNETSSSPKGGSGWLAGGCGCLTIALLLVTLVYFVITKEKPRNDFVNEFTVLAMESPTVIEILGAPLEIVERSSFNMEANKIEFRMPIKGSKKSGVVVCLGSVNEVGELRNAKKKLVRDSVRLEYDDQVIDLDLDEELTPEIDIDYGGGD